MQSQILCGFLEVYMPLSPMKNRLFVSFLALAALVVVPLSHARDSIPMEVERVNFSSERAGNRGNWQEIEIQLQINGYSSDQAKALELNNPNFLNDIEVILHLAYNVRTPEGRVAEDDQGEPKLVFYSSEVEIASLERNARNNQVLFYLPPEIVKRDRIRAAQEPARFLIELRADGREIPFSGRSARRMSDDLMNREAVSEFTSRVRSEASRNEGILMPIYKTPFWHGQRNENVPPYVW